MTQKEANNLQINCLRIINLYEVDYNLNIKIIDLIKATHLVEITKLLSENTWRVRSNYNIDNTTLIDKFVTEIHRISYIILCKFKDDAVACYNKIILAHTMLRSRNYDTFVYVYKQISGDNPSCNNILRTIIKRSINRILHINKR